MKKKCIQCKESKDIINFYKNNQHVDGLYVYCKQCVLKKKNKKDRTQRGLLQRIYGQQKQSCKERNHPLPEYTIDEFRKRFIQYPYFIKLYNEWEESKYETKLIPSFDRRDDSLGYTFENIVLTTWYENNKKSQKYLQEWHKKNREEKDKEKS